MLWTALFKPRLGKIREVVVEAGSGKGRAVAEAWARGRDGVIVGEVEPLVVADEGILGPAAEVPAATKPIPAVARA